MAKTVIAGNWKMHLDKQSGIELAEKIVKGLESVRLADDLKVVLCPSFPLLPIIYREILETGLHLGAQNVNREPEGPLTGEVSARVLVSVGCEYVIVGHSERRSNFAESDYDVCFKANAVVQNKLSPIICVGEYLAEREDGRYKEVIKRQVRTAMDGIFDFNAGSCIIAYEPVWAIGTGKTATPEEAEEVHAFIRSILVDLYNETTANSIPIIYGGSVNERNAAELMAQRNVDGALVGGASLHAEQFLSIIKSAAVSQSAPSV